MKKDSRGILKRIGFVLFLALTCTAAFSQTPESFVEKGKEAVKANNLNEAEANFKKALDMTKSKNVDILNSVAEGWMAKPEWASKAKPVLEKSINVKPTYKAKILLGDFYLSQGNGGLAISNYEDAAGIDSKNAEPHYKIGRVYVRSTNIDAAIEAFTKATQVDPNYANSYKELGSLYYTKKDGQNAVANQQKYLDLVKDQKDRDAGEIRMGYYQFMVRDFAKANALFKAADEKGLLKATGIRYYSLSLAQAEDFAGATKMFERYFALDTADAEAASDWKAYGDVLARTGSKESDSLASLAYAKSLEIDPKQVALLQTQAELLLKKVKHPGEAAEAYKKLIALRSKPMSADIFGLGQAYYYNQQFEQADSAFSALTVLQPTMTVGYTWAARSNAQLDPESTKGLAKEDFEKVIEVGKTDPTKNKADLIQAYSYLGYYYYLQKDLDKSLGNWKEVLALDPANEQAKTAKTSLEKMKAQPAKQPKS